MAINLQTLELVGNIGQFVVHLVWPVIGGWLMTRVHSWVKVGTRNDSIDGALSILKDLVTTTVQSAYQGALADAQANGGKLDGELAKKVRADALASIQRLYGQEGLANLAQRMYATKDATLELIGHLIDQAVLLLDLFKTGKVPPALPPPATDPPFDPNLFGGMTQQEKDAQAAADRAATLATPVVPEQA